jgi:L-fucose mutarotase
MHKFPLIHPQICAVLARAGHHAKILIADGNYPVSSKRGPNAELIHLNLSPGIVTCNQVLAAIVSAVPVQEAHTMMVEASGPYRIEGDPPVWKEYEQTLREAGLKFSLEPIEKWAFYDLVSTSDHVLTIQTGDQQRYANILLTVGVRMNKEHLAQ